jgi:hypothetical protein
MLEKFLSICHGFVKTFLEEKFKAFRSGFLAGTVISLPFLFNVQGLSHDLIWIFPLKLFMAVTFSFSTGLAAKGANDVYNYFKRKIFKSKNKTNERKKSDEDDRAA